jgi:hypothetical protein
MQSGAAIALTNWACAITDQFSVCLGAVFFNAPPREPGTATASWRVSEEAEGTLNPYQASPRQGQK